jgi:hypothetical protein
MPAKEPFPTAVHARADVHDTPDSEPPSGVGSVLHFRPFQCSASSPSGEKPVPPTAVQDLTEVHDTAVRLLEPERPAGLGTGWMAHLLPFQRSASGSREPPAVNCPTAVHALADVQDTPASALAVPPAGSWVRCTDHFLPFQCSASVPSRPLPTAVHARADVHDTADKLPPPGVR